MRILVTGANGFVGRAAVETLGRSGHQVIAVVRKPGADEQVAVGDIDATTDWRQALTECDVVVHLAARAHVTRDMHPDPMHAFRTVNTEGTLRLAEQAVAAGVRRFIFVSSIGVNGGQTPRGCAFTEQDTPQPHTPYAVSKYEAELGLNEIAERSGMELVSIRPPLIYGPGAPGNFRTLVKLVRTGLPLPLGGIHNLRSFVALDNLVSFIRRCVEVERLPRVPGRVFLLSDGEDVSTPELLRRVGAVYGKRVRLIDAPEHWMYGAARMLGKEKLAQSLMGSLVVDSTQARHLLGWQPVVTMEAQLRKMVENVALP